MAAREHHSHALRLRRVAHRRGDLFGEALLYRKLLSYRRIGALRLSLLLNAASFAAGLVIALVESFLT